MKKLCQSLRLSSLQTRLHIHACSINLSVATDRFNAALSWTFYVHIYGVNFSSTSRRHFVGSPYYRNAPLTCTVDISNSFNPALAVCVCQVRLPSCAASQCFVLTPFSTGSSHWVRFLFHDCSSCLPSRPAVKSLVVQYYTYYFFNRFPKDFRGNPIFKNVLITSIRLWDSVARKRGGCEVGSEVRVRTDEGVFAITLL